MSEASKEKYRTDGFMIKFFDIWPIGINKEDLFESQKIFLIYLMAILPSKEDFQINVEYMQKMKEIEDIKTVELDKTDIDLANLHGNDISKVRKERLKALKEKKKKELNEKYGIKEDKDEEEYPEIVNKNIEKNQNNPDKNQKEMLWDILNGKGLIKK